MASTLLCLAVLVVTGTLLGETSAISIRDALKDKDSDILEEAREALAGSYSNVRFSLAPSYGKLTSKSLQMLDKSLKVMMGGVLKLDLNTNYNWNDVMRILDKSPLTLRRPKDKVYKTNKIHFKSLKVLGIGPKKYKRKYAVRSWFTNLIGNLDVLKDTHIDLNRIIDLVTKFSVNMWTKLFTVKSRTVGLMDLGILRFPDVTQPFFSLYRIHLIGKCTFKTYIFYQKEFSDVYGVFHKEIYHPDRKYIESLSGGFTKQLINEVENLFKD